MLTDTLLVGGFPLPGSHPTSITFEYTTGQTIVLEGQLLNAWWEELAQMYMINQRLRMMNSMPTIPSNQLQEDDEDDESE